MFFFTSKHSQSGYFICQYSTCSMLLSLLKARLATEQCKTRFLDVGLPLCGPGSYLASLGETSQVGDVVFYNFLSVSYPKGVVAFFLCKKFIHCRSKLNLIINPEDRMIANSKNSHCSRDASILVTSEV